MRKSELEAEIASLKSQLEIAASARSRMSRQLELEQTHWQTICDEHNTLIQMLDKLFGFKVGASSFDDDAPLWDIRNKDGQVLVHHQKDLAEAYRCAIVAALYGADLGEPS